MALVNEGVDNLADIGESVDRVLTVLLASVNRSMEADS